ncbi:helix-turn-helix domain-containing protein [Streptomyces lateritius]|uniref:Helix-turn-helix domain-containing protein n=1 Tax=Streptomyces lateritius TaxID=67313 RepID=A0ABW6YJA7_9ACTN
MGASYFSQPIKTYELCGAGSCQLARSCCVLRITGRVRLSVAGDPTLLKRVGPGLQGRIDGVERWRLTTRRPLRYPGSCRLRRHISAGNGSRGAGCRYGQPHRHRQVGPTLRRGCADGTGRCRAVDRHTAGAGCRSGSGNLKCLLRRLRGEQGLTMGGLDRRARLGRTTTSQALNRGTVPSEATLVSLAQALRTSAEPLLKLRALACTDGNAPARVAACYEGTARPLEHARAKTSGVPGAGRPDSLSTTWTSGPRV